MRLSSVARTGVLTSSIIVMFVAAITGGVASAATCAGVQPTQHALGSWFEHCPDSEVALGYIYLLANPAGVNTAALNPVCREATVITSQFIQCQPEAGVLGDGQVTVEFDWGGPGAFVGCPSPTFFPNGGNRLHVHTVAQDGTSVLASVSFSVDFSSYVVEAAQPTDGSTFTPLACDDPARRLLRVDGSSSSGGNDSVNLTVFAPKISTDCDPGVTGAMLDLCNGASPIAAITPGRVYLQRGACPTLPTRDLRTPAWTFLADSDAQGHATVSFPTPAPGECVYLGATYRFNGQESPAIAGFLRRTFVNNCQDADGDGVTTCEGDCDDSNPHAYPGNTEVCDGIDNDCDGQVDEGLGTLTCGKGRCANVIPACSGGIPQTCPRGRPVKPPCGPPVQEEPVPIPVVPVP